MCFNDVDSVVSFESFRALILSNSEIFRALKLSLFESFRVIKFRNLKISIFEDFMAPNSLILRVIGP